MWLGKTKKEEEEEVYRYNLLGFGSVLYPNLAMTKSPCVAIEPQLGFSGVLGDFAIHLRHMPNPHGISYKGEVNTMIGYQWVIYF